MQTVYRNEPPDALRYPAGLLPESSRPRSRAASMSEDNLTPRPGHLYPHNTPSRQSSLVTTMHHQGIPPPRSMSDLQLPKAAQSQSPGKIQLNALRSYQSSGPTSLPLSHQSTLASSASSSNLASTPAGSRYGARNVAMAMDKFESRTDNRLEARAGDLGSVGAVGFGGTDELQTVAVRTLPLFNGEGVKGYIEDVSFIFDFRYQQLTKKTAQRIGNSAYAQNSRALTGQCNTLPLTASIGIIVDRHAHSARQVARLIGH